MHTAGLRETGSQVGLYVLRGFLQWPHHLWDRISDLTWYKGDDRSFPSFCGSDIRGMFSFPFP